MNKKNNKNIPSTPTFSFRDLDERMYNTHIHNIDTRIAPIFVKHLNVDNNNIPYELNLIISKIKDTYDK